MQTLSGKVPFGVLRRTHNVPVILISGRIEDVDALQEAGFSKIVEVSPRDIPLEKATARPVAEANLRRAVAEAVCG